MTKIRSALYIGIAALLLAGVILEHFQGGAIAGALTKVPGLGPLVAGSAVFVPNTNSIATSTIAHTRWVYSWRIPDWRYTSESVQHASC